MTNDTAQLTYQAELTDEMIAEAAALEGQPLRVEQYNHEATRDTIRRWCWGLGDDNPLYCDEAYAATSPHAGIVAPGTFLATVYSGQIGLGMVGIQPFGGGFRWTFEKTIHRGDRLSVDARVGPIKVVSGRHAGRFVVQSTQNVYTREDGTTVGQLEAWTLRVPRSKASGGLSYAPREPHRYTPEELEAIRTAAINEPLRGAEPRYWDDVAVGDEIPAVVKGPIDMTTMIAYYAGNHGTPRYKSTEIGWKYRTWATEAPENLPNNYDPFYYAESVSPSAGHTREDVAHEVGMPGTYNNGTQTMGWIGHAVQNWMGDDGFMSELTVRLRRPAIFGDTVWCRGQVTGRPSPGLVEIALDARSQVEEQVAEGSAIVRLPRRA
jgi:acyl dehydratase